MSPQRDIGLELLLFISGWTYDWPVCIFCICVTLIPKEKKGLQGTVSQAAGTEVFCELSIHVLSSACSNTASSLCLLKSLCRVEFCPHLGQL